jgi:hypothetical protein
MIDDDESYDVCSACSGSGEGMWDGSRCYKCHGTGCEPIEQGDDDEYIDWCIQDAKRRPNGCA